MCVTFINMFQNRKELLNFLIPNINYEYNCIFPGFALEDKIKK